MIESSQPSLRNLPLFPLPGFFLFPGAIAPLHVFEPRYRQMVNDLLDRAGRLVLDPMRADIPDAGSTTDALPVAGLGEIVHHEAMADGRFLIWVLGLGRVTACEVASDRLYRKVDVHLVADRQPRQNIASALSPQLHAAIESRAPAGQTLDGELPLGLLADMLLNALPLDAVQAAAVFGERCPEVRAKQALAWHQVASVEQE